MSLPAVPSNPSPAVDTAGVDEFVVLSWDCPGATSCIVFATEPDGAANGRSLENNCHIYATHDGSGWHLNGDVNYAIGAAETYAGGRWRFLSPNDLGAALRPPNTIRTAVGQALYWRVVGVNADGFTVGPVWRFTTAPVHPPTVVGPSDGAATVAYASALTWAADGAASYDVKFGTVNPPPTVATGLSSPSYSPTLAPATTYFWQVVARSADPAGYTWRGAVRLAGSVTGPVWSFTTAAAPAVPSAPSPANSAGSIATSPTLTWTAAGATSYDVKVETVNPPLAIAAAGLAAAAYTLPLADLTTFYWQVIAKNAGFATPGPVWSFTTAEETVTILTTTATGTQNNLNPGTLGTLNVLRCNNATLLTLTGLTNNGATPTDGAMVWVESVGAGQVDIANQNASSTAANRVINNVTGTISLAAGCGRALLCYDGTAARWRVLEHEQGAYIHPAYNAGDFTGFLSMTWTVDAGDVFGYSYYLKGRQLTVAINIANSTVGGTPSQSLLVAVPGGFTSAAHVVSVGTGRDNGAALETIQLTAQGGGASVIQCNRGFNGTFWSASTNQTSVDAQITFEVQ
jgi:hypothetical protein